ncbi:MAG: hypothetical protein PW845_27180 [Pseudomonas sp.]|uniref:hypothetical protein n=1 Tax=Pseudomonas abieticivorans TaxID=2931382 RepID=UPI0020BE31C9|nr:hypothetical protein [Pseudomonas sp. PIA16]MDE1168966.1 hypothetical protein [Pseudomonas sp.]
MKYLTCACAAALLLAGCGNLANVRAYSTPYGEPQSGDTARLRVITNGMLRAVPGRDCIDWRSPGAGVMAVTQSGFANRNNQVLGMPPGTIEVHAQGDSVARTELKIPAGKPTAFNFQSEGSVSGGYRYSCQQSFRFTPEAGKDYQLIVLEGGQCQLNLQTLGGGESQVALQKASLCNAADAF